MPREFYTLYVEMGCDPPITICVEIELLMNSYNEQCVCALSVYSHGTYYCIEAEEIRVQNKG